MGTRDERLSAAFTALAELAAFPNCVDVEPDPATGEPFIGVYPGELSTRNIATDLIVSALVALISVLDDAQVTAVNVPGTDYAKVTGRIGPLPVRIVVQAEFLTLLGLPEGGA